MTDEYPAPDQHDTTALPRTGPGASAPGAPTSPAYGYGQPGTQSGPGYGPGWYGGPAGAPPVGNPEAERWAARYRRQRTITTVLAIGVAVALVGVLGMGVAAWQFARSNPVLDSVSELAEGLGGSPEGLLPEDLLPEGEEGLVPDGTSPDGTSPDGEAPGLSELPLPEPLRGLGSALGITDVGQLLDLAVANGLMTQAEADDLRRAIAAGSALQGLADGSQQ
jgi:hypothetical protein